MKRAKSKLHGLQNVVDHLERRTMMSAAILSQIPSPTLHVGGVQSIGLGTYFDDSSIPSTDTVLEIQTNLPSPYNLIPVELTTASTPNTVANFLKYISNGDYADTVFQRSVPSFVIQGGGFTDTGAAIPSLGAINSEASTATLNNSAGTIAMALSTGPNTGSNQWFFNLVNNDGTSAPYNVNLNNSSDGGPFTAFGQVIYQGMTVLNHIASLPIVDDTGQGEGQWSSLPVQSGTNGASVTTEAISNLVTLDPVVVPTGLVYNVNSSNAGVITASASGGHLTLTPVGTGTATVTVTAEDLGLGTVSQSFQVTVDSAVSLPAVSVGNAAGTVGTNTQINFPITLSNASISAITLDYSLTAGTAPASDYQSTGSTLTIPAGSTSATIPVNLLANSTGSSQTFSITLSSLSSNAVFGTNASTETATGIINPAGTTSTVLSLGGASGTAGTNSQIVFPITLSEANSAATTLDYTLTAGSAPASDFAATGSSVSIPAGSTTANIPVTLIQDSTGTPETFTITVSNLSSNAVLAGGLASLAASGVISPAVVVGPVTTTTTLTASTPVIALDGAVTLTATVAAAASSAVPTGTIIFENGGVTVGTVALVNGVATTTLNLTTAGDAVFTAVYSGDSTNLTSTSGGLTVNAATLPPVVSKSTVPTSAVSGQPVKGTTAVGLTNNTGAVEKGKVTVNLYASSDGAIDGSAVLVATVTKSVNLKTGKTATVPVSVKTFPATLGSGTYTLLSQTINTAGQISNAATGPTVTLAAPVVSLSETFTKLVLPPSVVAGAKTSAVAVLKITNSGNVISSGTTILSLYASTDGTVANGTLINTIAKKLAIKAGKFVNVQVPLAKYPAVADGSYSIIAQITDPNGGISQQTFGTPVTIAAPIIELSAVSVSVPANGSIGKGITVTINLTNNGNIAAKGVLDIGIGAATDSNGDNPISLGSFSVVVNIKPYGKQVIHLKVPVPRGTPSGNAFIVATLQSDNVFGSSDFTNPTAISPTTVNLT